MDSHSEIEDQAAEWLARRDSGNWSEEDEARLQEWTRSSTARHVAYLRLKSTWDTAGRLRALRTTSAGGVPAPGEWRRSPFFEQSSTEGGITNSEPVARHGRRYGALAATVVLALAVGFGAFQAWKNSGERYATPVGGLASVPISDGSSVTLNTASVIRVDVSDKERRVLLEQGEAFFDVAKDPTRPFVVYAGDKRIVAVGTKFSVQHLGEDVRVLVTEGRVRVEGASSPVLIAAGSVARADGSAVVVQKAQPPQVEEFLSWREGYLRFHETALADAVAEMNRYNTRKIFIEDPALAAIRISGTFRPTQYEAFVRVLQDGFSIQARNEAERITLSQAR